MLIYRRTSLLESSAQTLVNTVNCVGVMGKGIAKEFRNREPQMYAAYRRICEQKLLRPGKLWLWKGSTQWVLNFPTKDHWRNPSKLEWIEQGLQKFVSGFSELGIREISFPRLGCGNGGLNWDDVQPVMEHYLGPLKIQIFIHDFDKKIGLPEHLEHIPSVLAGQIDTAPSYTEFLSMLPRVIELAGPNFIDLSSHERLSAGYDGTELRLSTPNVEWAFDAEDLWGIWVSLQKGFLTQEKAGWAAFESGSALISLLALLPFVRLIEIQRFGDAASELALELAQPAASMAPADAQLTEQMTLQWH